MHLLKHRVEYFEKNMSVLYGGCEEHPNKDCSHKQITTEVTIIKPAMSGIQKRWALRSLMDW